MNRDITEMKDQTIPGIGINASQAEEHHNFEIPTRYQNRNLNIYFSSKEKIIVA